MRSLDTPVPRGEPLILAARSTPSLDRSIDASRDGSIAGARLALAAPLVSAGSNALREALPLAEPSPPATPASVGSGASGDGGSVGDAAPIAGTPLPDDSLLYFRNVLDASPRFPVVAAILANLHVRGELTR